MNEKIATSQKELDTIPVDYNGRAMHECTIGLWLDYEDTDTVTFSRLKDEVDGYANFVKWKNENLPQGKEKVKTLSDYLDKRKRTNLQRFDYCPYCGKKIDWKGLRENADSQ